MKPLVTKTLGLEINRKKLSLTTPREYGYADELMIVFSASKTKGGLPYTVTEEEFRKLRHKREIGIFGCDDPLEAGRLCRHLYPNVTLLMRIVPKH